MKKNTVGEILLRLVVCEPTTLPTGCWEYPRRDTKGYGRAALDGRERKVHQIVYEHFVGPMPIGLIPDHLCRNRCCANFEHIEPVTYKVNKQRSADPNRAKTHCKFGHPYNERNTYVKKSGARGCRACGALRRRRHVARLKADLAALQGTDTPPTPAPPQP